MPNNMNAGSCGISFILQETTKFSSTVDKLFDIPSSREQEFLLLHVSITIALEFGHLITTYIIHVMVVSFCIFPDINYCIYQGKMHNIFLYADFLNMYLLWWDVP